MAFSHSSRGFGNYARYRPRCGAPSPAALPITLKHAIVALGGIARTPAGQNGPEDRHQDGTREEGVNIPGFAALLAVAAVPAAAVAKSAAPARPPACDQAAFKAPANTVIQSVKPIATPVPYC